MDALDSELKLLFPSSDSSHNERVFAKFPAVRIKQGHGSAVVVVPRSTAAADAENALSCPVISPDPAPVRGDTFATDLGLWFASSEPFSLSETSLPANANSKNLTGNALIRLRVPFVDIREVSKTFFGSSIELVTRRRITVVLEFIDGKSARDHAYDVIKKLWDTVQVEAAHNLRQPAGAAATPPVNNAVSRLPLSTPSEKRDLSDALLAERIEKLRAEHAESVASLEVRLQVAEEQTDLAERARGEAQRHLDEARASLQRVTDELTVALAQVTELQAEKEQILLAHAASAVSPTAVLDSDSTQNSGDDATAEATDEHSIDSDVENVLRQQIDSLRQDLCSAKAAKKTADQSYTELERSLVQREAELASKIQECEVLTAAVQAAETQVEEAGVRLAQLLTTKADNNEAAAEDRHSEALAAKEQELRTAHAEEMAFVRNAHESEVKRLHDEHAAALEELRQVHATDLDRVRSDAIAELGRLQASHELTFAQRAEAHIEQISRLKLQHETALAKLQAEAAADTAASLTALREELGSSHASQIDVLNDKLSRMQFVLEQERDAVEQQLEQFEKDKAAERFRLKSENESDLSRLQDAHRRELDNMRTEIESAVASSAESAEHDRVVLLARHQAELEETTARLTAELETAQAAVTALETKKAVAESSLEQSHQQALSEMASRLRAAEARHSQAQSQAQLLLAEEQNAGRIASEKHEEEMRTAVHEFEDHKVRWAEDERKLREHVDVIQTSLQIMKDKYEPDASSDDESDSNSAAASNRSWKSGFRRRPTQTGYWEIDADVTMCPVCQSAFSAVKRKHHCRRCGRIFCYHCTNHKFLLPDVDPKKALKICDLCFSQLAVVVKTARG